MGINDTTAYMVARFSSEGESNFHPIIGEDVKNMLRNFSYDPENDEYVSEDGTVRYKLTVIG